MTVLLAGILADSPLSSGITCFIQILFFWCANLVAIEIESPFGDDPNDLPLERMQEDVNTSLWNLLDTNAQAPPEFCFDPKVHFVPMLAYHPSKDDLDFAFKKTQTQDFDNLRADEITRSTESMDSNIHQKEGHHKSRGLGRLVKRKSGARFASSHAGALNYLGGLEDSIGVRSTIQSCGPLPTPGSVAVSKSYILGMSHTIMRGQKSTESCGSHVSRLPPSSTESCGSQWLVGEPDKSGEESYGARTMDQRPEESEGGTNKTKDVAFYL